MTYVIYVFCHDTTSDHFNRATSLGHDNYTPKIVCAAADGYNKIKMVMVMLSFDFMEKLSVLDQQKCI